MAIKTTGIVQPMVQRELTVFYSRSQGDIRQIACIIAALLRYKNTIQSAAKKLEQDLKKCQNPIVMVKKPIPKKKL